MEFIVDTAAPTPLLTEPSSSGVYAKEPLKAILIGSPKVVIRTIHVLHSRGIADQCWWSPLVPAGNLGHPGEVMSILLRRIAVE